MVQIWILALNLIISNLFEFLRDFPRFYLFSVMMIIILYLSAYAVPLGLSNWLIASAFIFLQSVYINIYTIHSSSSAILTQCVPLIIWVVTHEHGDNFEINWRLWYHICLPVRIIPLSHHILHSGNTDFSNLREGMRCSLELCILHIRVISSHPCVS